MKTPGAKMVVLKLMDKILEKATPNFLEIITN